MKPNQYIAELKEYPLVSHAAWELRKNAEILKMDWNEADVILPEAVRQAVIDFVSSGPTQWYPDISNQKLIDAIAHYLSVPQKYVQYFGGEDAALDYVVRTFITVGDTVAVVGPAYDNFRVFAESVGARVEYVTLGDIFNADVSELEKQIPPEAKLIYLVNPNNPTGVLYSVDEIEALLQTHSDKLLLIDEAYAEFSGVTTVGLVEKYQNLIVGRSLSKAFGLASFRLGYVVTSPNNLLHINKIRNGKNISALAQIAAIAALDQPQYMERYVREVDESKRKMAEGLTKLGFSVKTTSANFLLIEIDNPSEFCDALKKQNIFIRNLGHLSGMEHYVRVTVGSEKNTDTFLNLLSELIKDGHVRPQ